MSPDVKMQLEDGVAAFAASAGSTKGSVIGELAKLILDIVEKQAGIDADEMAAFVGQLYDRYVAPLDLPGVPDAFEMLTDQVLKAALVSLVKKAIQSVRAV